VSSLLSVGEVSDELHSNEAIDAFPPPRPSLRRHISRIFCDVSVDATGCSRWLRAVPCHVTAEGPEVIRGTQHYCG